MMERFKDPVPPLLIGVGFLILWEIAVLVFAVPPYVLPGPVLGASDARLRSIK